MTDEKKIKDCELLKDGNFRHLWELTTHFNRQYRSEEPIYGSHFYTDWLLESYNLKPYVKTDQIKYFEIRRMLGRLLAQGALPLNPSDDEKPMLPFIDKVSALYCFVAVCTSNKSGKYLLCAVHSGDILDALMSCGLGAKVLGVVELSGNKTDFMKVEIKSSDERFEEIIIDALKVAVESCEARETQE